MELNFEEIKSLSPEAKTEKISKAIEQTLKNSPNGLTINQIMELTRISRETIEKHLQTLLFSNVIYDKKFGPTRVYFPNHRVHHLEFKKFETSQGRTIWLDILENEFGKYLWIAEQRKIGDTYKRMGSIIVPIEKINDFVDNLKQLANSSRIKQLLKT